MGDTSAEGSEETGWPGRRAAASAVDKPIGQLRGLVPQTLQVLGILGLVVAVGCAVERFDAASCVCVAEHPGSRGVLEELQLRRCVLGSRGEGANNLDEKQCRLWLASPWLAAPPEDDVAGRVIALPMILPHGCGSRAEGPGHDERIPWLQDDSCDPGLWAPDDEPLPEVAVREQSLAAACPNMAETACRHRYLTQAVELLRPLAVAADGSGSGPLLLPLFCVIRADGGLDLASIGHHWWRLPPAKGAIVPRALAAETPRVDVGALIAEVRWMRQLYPELRAEVAAEDSVLWGDVWAVWWALDELVTADRSDRHWSRIHEPVLPNAASGDDGNDTIEIEYRACLTCRQLSSRHRLDYSDPNILRGIGWRP